MNEREQLYKSQLEKRIKAGNEEKTFAEWYNGLWIIFYLDNRKGWTHLTTISQYLKDIEGELRKPYYKAQIPEQLVEVK